MIKHFFPIRIFLKIFRKNNLLLNIHTSSKAINGEECFIWTRDGRWNMNKKNQIKRVNLGVNILQ